MNKKSIIGIIIAIVVVLLAGAGVVYLLNRPKDADMNTDQASDSNNNQEEIKVKGGKILVAYYSAQNHTKAVAEQIAENLGADLFEIVPQEVYTAEDLDWTADGSRVNREHNDESLRDIALVTTTPENWGDYETVLIGYPIWWAIAAWPVDNFVKGNDFAGKTVIPFATSTSSGLGQSGELLEAMANGGEWLTGRRFSSNPASTEIKSWTDSLR